MRMHVGGCARARAGSARAFCGYWAPAACAMHRASTGGALFPAAHEACSDSHPPGAALSGEKKKGRNKDGPPPLTSVASTGCSGLRLAVR